MTNSPFQQALTILYEENLLAIPACEEQSENNIPLDPPSKGELFLSNDFGINQTRKDTSLNSTSEEKQPATTKDGAPSNPHLKGVPKAGDVKGSGNAPRYPAPKFLSRLQEYAALIRRWNNALHLVSDGDLAHIEDIHIVDALSLAPYVAKFADPETGILDIGSGGGFPIIPLKCLFPDMPCTLIERSEKKVGFLHRVVARLKLTNIEVLHGVFPETTDPITASIITARAVERPEKLIPALLNHIPETSTFLCQAPLDKFTVPETFHVEHINDFWAYAELRRGTLALLQKKSS